MTRTVCIVAPYWPSLTETFIRLHVDELPAKVVLVHGWRPAIGNRTVLSFPTRVAHKLWRMVSGTGLELETRHAYSKVFRRHRVSAVLAEYGETGVQCRDACRRAGLPLIVHFHGYDASENSVLREHAETYPRLFQEAAAIIAVSHAMRQKLISLGAPAEKIHYNPYGVDCEKFGGANPGDAAPLLIAVGRFTAKKAPQLTLSAFAQAYRDYCEARLLMIGNGPMLNECRELAATLGVDRAVTFMGDQSHAVVRQEMRRARCFVQHSVVAPSGDAEGTPVAIIEAGASGLPVISTRHGGIPDVVLEGETGFLVDEGDVDGMARFMTRMLREPSLAARMGKVARAHIEHNFSKDRRLGELWRIIESCIDVS